MWFDSHRIRPPLVAIFHEFFREESSVWVALSIVIPFDCCDWGGTRAIGGDCCVQKGAASLVPILRWLLFFCQYFKIFADILLSVFVDCLSNEVGQSCRGYVFTRLFISYFETPKRKLLQFLAAVENISRDCIEPWLSNHYFRKVHIFSSIVSPPAVDDFVWTQSLEVASIYRINLLLFFNLNRILLDWRGLFNLSMTFFDGLAPSSLVWRDWKRSSALSGRSFKCLWSRTSREFFRLVVICSSSDFCRISFRQFLQVSSLFFCLAYGAQSAVPSSRNIWPHAALPLREEMNNAGLAYVRANVCEDF